MSTSKTAVVLLNLGGPDSLKAVKPFLFNLFNDRAIIDLPQPLRWMLAQFISTLRNSKAQGIYKYMGGKSPILDLTLKQAEALEKKLLWPGKKNNTEYKVFVCMRHWHPMSSVVAKKVKSYAPDQVILLPLYPQFSTTTTGSAFTNWQQSCKKNDLDIPTSAVCCYPEDRGFVAAHAKVIKDMYWKAADTGKPRLIFSAHGLPEKIILGGDPYQWQIERSVEAIKQVLAIDELDYVISYQSRVGRLEWIGPSTEEEIIHAGNDRMPVLLIPIAFVSEHSETLVELDIDYRKLAERNGVPAYHRVPALGTDEFFIETLADLCVKNTKTTGVQSATGARICPNTFGKCLCAAA